MEASSLIRTLEGRITSWNRRAEQLYGWHEQEAVGRVSHELLRTEFPEELDEIEADLLEHGEWRGRLVHATRDGGRLVVESRWVLKDADGTRTVVEINEPSMDAEVESKSVMDARTAEAGKYQQDSITSQTARAIEALRSAAVMRKVSLWFFSLLAAGWIIYAAVGHDIIRWLYVNPPLGVFDQYLEGRGVIPLANYYRGADALVVYTTLRLIAVYALMLLLIRAPAGLIVLAISSVVTSLLLFAVFELVPSLIRPSRVELISPYHAYKASYLYDDKLAYREKPFNYFHVENFRGSHYSPLYGIDIAPWAVDWRVDEHGFRNPETRDAAEIVAVGDSFLEFGDNTTDTFVGRLQRKLDGVKIANLGKSGYGPDQYLEVLKRYGISYKPRYALFGFYEGNDIANIEDFATWKRGERDNRYVFLKFSQSSFLRRYLAAMGTMFISIRGMVTFVIETGLDSVARRGGYAAPIHPKLAQLDMGGGVFERMLFVDRLDNSGSIDTMLDKEGWRALERILVEFKTISAAHGIVPIVLYIPAAAHVYAEYSTAESGLDWLKVRNSQVTAKKKTYAAFARLARRLDIEIIDLSMPLEKRAREGLLYHPLDTHWTAFGREVAAEFVANQLKARFLTTAAQ